MTQTIVALDLIKRSMNLINALPAGATPNDQDANDALIVLNELIDSWNLQPLAVYSSANENWVVTPGQATYEWGVTAGPTGFTSERPVFVNSATCIRNGFSTPIDIITQPQYDLIALKTTPSPIIERVLYVNAFPNGILTFFPVPTEAVTFNVNVNRNLVGPMTLQSVIAMPPGYQKLLRYALAVDIWPEFQNTTTDIASIKATAKEIMGQVKVANIQDTPSIFSDIPGVVVGRTWDWRGS